MGSLLALRMNALAGVLNELGRRAEFPVGRDGEHRYAAAVIVRDQEVPTRAVEHEIAGAVTLRWLLIDKLQLARWAFDGEGADAAGRVGIDGEDHAALQVEFQEGRVGGLGRTAK